jgi:hypothetical protein
VAYEQGYRHDRTAMMCPALRWFTIACVKGHARIVFLGAAFCVVLVAVGPAIARSLQTRLVSVVAHGISGSVTYKVTNEGRDVGQTTTGVVGQGTISGKLNLGATLAARLLGTVKGIPLTGITSGGTYVVRYDIDARGDHTGLVVIAFKSRGLGTLCTRFAVAYGRFVVGKTDYVPSTGTFSTAGGDGTIAKVRASGSFTQGEVTGNAIEQILAHGSLASLTTGAAMPPTAECAAVAKLALHR